MNMIANRDEFLPQAPQAHQRPPVARAAWHLVPLAALLLYASYAAVIQVQQAGPRPFVRPGIGIDKLPQMLAGLQPAERQALIARERAVLASEPLDRAAVERLSLLFSADGDAKRGDDMTIAASTRALRDAGAQARALPLKLQRGDIGGALTALDALIRAEPDARLQLFATLASVAKNEAAMEPLVRLLAEDPPWRSDFLNWTAGKSGQPDLAYRIISALKPTKAAARSSEMQILLRHFLDQKDYGTAYFIWLDLLSEPELRKTGNLFDGGFDLPFSSLYFSWTQNRALSVETRRAPRANASADNVLRVDFMSNRAQVAPIYQYLRLAPGRYIFSGDAKAENLLTDSGLSWRIQCIEGAKLELASSPALSGDGPWDHFETRVDVPENCVTQRLLLGARSDAVLDQQVSGTALYDNLSIVLATEAQ
jgi:hypothetical protein